MQLKSGQVYKIYVYNAPMYCPTLSIKGEAQIYVSLSAEMPKSTNEMFLVDDFKNDAINTVIGMFRWICPVYESGSNVEECGLVTSPFINKK